jgi:hypothetical protein
MANRLSFALAAVFAQAACIVTPAPPPEHTPRPAPAPAPEPAPRPEPPPAPEPAPPPAPEPPTVTCDVAAPPIYVETSTPIHAQHEVTGRFVVRSSGAWSRTQHGQAQQGCLTGQQLEALRGALAAADFTPPPPPEIVCMALPTERVVYEDVAQQRRAAVEQPCGREPINPSVLALARYASSLATGTPEPPPPPAPAPPPPPPEPPAACAAPASLLVGLSVGPVRHAGRDGLPRAPMTTVSIGTDGGWMQERDGEVSCGQLSRRDLRRLRAQVRSADVRTVNKRITCRALPTTEYRLRTGAGHATWQVPCGAAEPTSSAEQLVDLVQSLAR